MQAGGRRFDPVWLHHFRPGFSDQVFPDQVLSDKAPLKTENSFRRGDVPFRHRSAAIGSHRSHHLHREEGIYLSPFLTVLQPGTTHRSNVGRGRKARGLPDFSGRRWACGRPLRISG